MEATKFDRLERLTKLKAEGALNDTEFAAAKARLLREDLDSTAALGSAEGSDKKHRPRGLLNLSPTWLRRFRFIDEHGLPNSAGYEVAIQSVPFWERTGLFISRLAFLIGPFYFLYLGLWKPAITLLGFGLIYAVILDQIDVPGWLDRVSFVIPAMAYAWTCIPLYYLKVRQGIHSWNPLVWRTAANGTAAAPSR